MAQLKSEEINFYEAEFLCTITPFNIDKKANETTFHLLEVRNPAHKQRLLEQLANNPEIVYYFHPVEMPGSINKKTTETFICDCSKQKFICDCSKFKTL